MNFLFNKSIHILALCVIAAGFCSVAQAGEQVPPSSGNIAQALRPFVDSNSLPGAVVLVADKDKILDLEAAGYSDLETKKPMTTDSYFWIASMSKSITACALMMLADEGKLSIDDPVQKYLPEFANLMVVDPKDPAHTPHKPSHPILISEILSHTSGLPNHTKGPGPRKDDSQTLEERAHFYSTQTLETDPGTAYAYTNLGPNLAGRIIEVVSGMSYVQFLQTRIFDPLGMKETTFNPTPGELARLATAYKLNDAKTGFAPVGDLASFTYPLSDPKRQPMPAGGLFSTAIDISKFCQMLLNGGTYHGKTFLSPNAIRQMTINRAPEQGKDRYGLGFGLGPNGVFFHAGGYKTYMEINPKTGRIWVYMVQYFGHDWPNDGSKVMGVLKAAIAKIPAQP